MIPGQGGLTILMIFGIFATGGGLTIWIYCLYMLLKHYSIQ